MRIPPDGGAPEPVMSLDSDHQVLSQGFPTFLPGGERFVYLQVSRKPEHSGITSAH